MTLFECKGNLIQRKTVRNRLNFRKTSINCSKTSINFQTCLVVAHEEAKTYVASLQKELFEIAELKTLTTKSINWRSHIFPSSQINFTVQGTFSLFF